MHVAQEIAPSYGVRATCAALGLSHATFYRRRRAGSPSGSSARKPPRKLTDQEEQRVLNTLNSERFGDQAVPEVHATLLDEGVYLCSPRTMYRILKRHQELRERRAQRRHPLYRKPELWATGPNQLWSWDITKVKGPAPWIFYHLYVMIDVYSRYVVGWVLSEYETGEQAEALIDTCCQRQGIGPHQLTIHSDRGKSMRAKGVLDLLTDLKVQRSYSRPHVSDDNPYSEAQFKTIKYHPTYPERFGSPEDSRSYFRGLLAWYNTEHRHSGIAFMTPEDVYLGRADGKRQNRDQTLASAYAAHPERFVKGQPKARSVPRQVWINKPADSESAG
jgi:putative transposase